MPAPSPSPIPPSIYSRLPQQTFSAPLPARPTRTHRALEWTLFFSFGSTVAVAIIALVVSASTSHRTVPNRVADGLAADRVNVLLVVTTPERYRESTEALMLVSVRPSSGETAVLSIPTDLWVRLGRYGTRRIGSALSVGRLSGYPGRGPGLVADTVAEVFDQPVHAFVRMTPAQVARAVDAAGGLTLQLRHGAYDTKSGDRFVRGRREHLNGTRAVRYALSSDMARPANGRFAREARQRELAAALLARDNVTAIASSGVQTNLTPQQASALWNHADGRPPRVITLAPYVDVFNVSTIVDQGEALRPRLGIDLHRIAASVFSPAFANR